MAGDVCSILKEIYRNVWITNEWITTYISVHVAHLLDASYFSLFTFLLSILFSFGVFLDDSMFYIISNVF